MDTKPVDLPTVMLSIRNLVCGSVGLICNCVALGGLVRQKDLTCQFRMHLMSIIIANVLLNVFIVVHMILVVIGHRIPPVPCIVSLSCILFSIMCNSSLTLALAVDRLCAVFAPFQYKAQLATKKNVSMRISLAIVSVVPILLLLFVKAPIPKERCYSLRSVTGYGVLAMGIHTTVCSCATVAIYVSILLKLMPPCLCCGRRHSTLHSSPSMTQTDEKTRRLTIWSALFTAWFCVSYIPFGAYVISTALSFESKIISERTTTRFLMLTFAPFINAIVDPFIVFWHVGVFGAISRCIRRLALGLRRLVQREAAAHS